MIDVLDREVELARRGGSPKRFCSPAHRIAFWSALRRWAERAVAAGVLTGADIKKGAPAACTLPLGAISRRRGTNPSEALTVALAKQRNSAEISEIIN